MTIQINISDKAIKWLAVLLISIVFSIGITTAYPSIGDRNSYFGFIHGDGGNISGVPATQLSGNVPKANMPANVTYNNSNNNFTALIYFAGMTAEGSTYDAVCRNSADGGRGYYNTGLATCTVSGDKFKINSKELTPADIDLSNFFLAFAPIQYNLKDGSDASIHYGFSANTVSKYYPSLAVYDVDGSVRGLKYEESLALFALKLKEQENININQQNEINDLKYQIELLKGNKAAIASTPIPIVASSPTWWEFWK